MKALTLWQPWAQLIALGHKTIETRSWSTKHRGPLAIHAGASARARVIREAIPLLNAAGYQENPACRVAAGPHHWSPLPLGVIVATCTLVDVVRIIDGFDDDVFENEGWPPIERSCARLGIWPQNTRDVVLVGGGRDRVEIHGEVPFGDYTPGRFAWLLDDITPLDDPVPAVGHQGLWEWTP